MLNSQLANVAHTHTHTHTRTHTRLTTLCPGLSRWASTRKVKPICILLKQETVSGSGISWAICKSAPHSRQITMPAPHHSVFTGRMPFLPPNQQRQSIYSSILCNTFLCGWQIVSTGNNFFKSKEHVSGCGATGQRRFAWKQLLNQCRCVTASISHLHGNIYQNALSTNTRTSITGIIQTR